MEDKEILRGRIGPETVARLRDEEIAERLEEFRTMQQLYSAAIREIRTKLEQQADAKAEAAFENAVIEKISENAQVDIPDAMIEDQVDAMMRDMEMRMAYQGMRIDDYYKYTGQTEEQVRTMYKPSAAERVRTNLIIEAVMKAENIQATEEEVDAEMTKYADQNKKTLDEFKAMLSDGDKAYFAEIASMQKTVDFIKANAK